MTVDDAVAPRADRTLSGLNEPIYPTFIIKSCNLLTGDDKNIISNYDTLLLRLNEHYSCFTLGAFQSSQGFFLPCMRLKPESGDTKGETQEGQRRTLTPQ